MPKNIVLTYTPEEDETIVEGCFKDLKELSAYIEDEFIGGEEIVVQEPTVNGKEMTWDVHFDGNDYPSGTLKATLV